MKKSVALFLVVGLLAFGAVALVYANKKPLVESTPAIAHVGATVSASPTVSARLIDKPGAVAPAAPTPVPSVAKQTPAETAVPTPAVASPAAPAPVQAPTTEKAPAAELTPAQKSVKEALDTGKFPERLGAMTLPTELLDLKRWASDQEYAQKWLDTHEPGRVFQPAQPSPTTPVIERVGGEDIALPDGGSVELHVRVPPGSAVTFNSFDSGAFKGSALSCISVRADAEGVARATFAQSPGTVGRCRILVASPHTSGQASFVVAFADPPVAATLPPVPATP